MQSAQSNPSAHNALYQSARNFLEDPCREKELLVLDDLRIVLDSKLDGAYVEYGCLEFGVVHVHYPQWADPEVTASQMVLTNETWYIIDPETCRMEIA